MFTIEVQLPEALNVSLEMVFSARSAFLFSSNYLRRREEDDSYILVVMGFTIAGEVVTQLTWHTPTSEQLNDANARSRGFPVTLSVATPKQVFEIATAMMEDLVDALKRRNIAVELKSDPGRFELSLVETAEA